MSLLEDELQAEADESQGAAARSPATLTAFRRGMSGVMVPIITTIIAFIAGGLIVLATGHNPLSTYQSIFNGTGLNWLFPWVSGSERATAAGNLQQTLLNATPLIPWVRVRVRSCRKDGTDWVVGCQFLKPPASTVMWQFG